MQLPNNKGFTLIEILIVIAIFAIGAAIAIPSIMDMGSRDQVKTEARQFKDQLARARATAIEQNSPVTITITANSYTVGSNIITLRSTTLNPVDALTWDQRGYPSKAIDITVSGTSNAASYKVSVTIAGGISIAKP